MNHAMDRFLALMKALQAVDPEFPLQYAVCLIQIALNEGISLTGLSEKTGIPLSTVSRIVGALSARRQKGAPYELVTAVISTTERRKKELYLSPRGHSLALRIMEIMASDNR